MGVYVSVITEIASRLNLGAVALGIKSIQVMHKQERLQPDMTPYIQILPDNNFIAEEYGASIQHNRKNANVALVLFVEYPIEARDNYNSLIERNYIVDTQHNKLVDSDGNYIVDSEILGFLIWLEKLLDRINTDSADGLEPQLITTATRSIDINVTNVTKYEMTISAEINLVIGTQPFIINNRQNI
jgi:hypothetical protein